MITHKHLRLAIEDYCVNDSKELLLRLINELRYSSLYIPSRRRDGKLVFDIYEEGTGLKLTPLFTDLDEVRKFYGSQDVEVFSNSFELYQNVLKTNDIEGYILNPASEKYLLESKFILAIRDIPKTTYVTSNPYSPEDLKEMANNTNPALESFVEKRQNVGNYEALFEMMSDSTIMAMMISDRDLTPFFKDGILNMQLTGPVASMYVDEIGGKYACIFSSRQKMGEVKSSKYKYAQIVNLSMLVNFVLTEDMDGIILNPSADDVLIPRQTLLNYSVGFEKYANDERLSDSMYYIFQIE